MNSINDIVFYELKKKRPQGIKKTKWVRRTSFNPYFEEKVKVIRMRAERINQKLVNY